MDNGHSPDNCPGCRMVKILKAVEVVEREDVKVVCEVLINSISFSHSTPRPDHNNPAFVMGVLAGLKFAIDALNVPNINSRNIELLKSLIANACECIANGPLGKSINELATGMIDPSQKHTVH